MRAEWVMYAWAVTQSCGPAPVDVGPVLQERSAAAHLTLFFFLLHFFLSPHTGCSVALYLLSRVECNSPETNMSAHE